ncbi:unnamed protein product [Auanema sp. JU1783]|nr:unnamed protein product [Auanema sp. JU1783]
MNQVRADYDFDAQPGSGEMSIRKGEILTVLRGDVEGGWIEGRNTSGKIGLFPESYVSPYSGPPAVSPPNLPPAPVPKPPPVQPSRATGDDWGVSSFHPPPASYPSVNNPSTQSQSGSASQINDEFDDEWTDDDENEEPALPNSHHAVAPNDVRGAINRSQSAGDRAGSKVNRNINRFSNFVKSGMEAYVLGESKMNGQPGEKHEIVSSSNMVQWKPIQQYYTCTLGDKIKKETKLKGLKSFIAYSITSSLRRIQVSRRYKQFDWLHEQLSAKYIMIPIPPLPEKQVSGRYEEDLIDHRKHILQIWVNKICRHPVLSQSEVWLHFISCTDEKEWKNGKRKAEKDEYVGGNFLNCVSVPQVKLDIAHVEGQVEKFQKNVKFTEDATNVMHGRMKEFQKVYQGPVKSNWQKMAHAFSSLGQTFNDDHPKSGKLAAALNVTASQYHSIGEEFDVHTRNDMEPVVEALFSFKGTVQGVPDILSIHKQAIQKYRENQSKVSNVDAEKIKQRVDSISYSVLAEMNHLNSEKIEDVRSTMGTYLRKQADFYQKLANQFANMASQYDF